MKRKIKSFKSSDFERMLYERWLEFELFTIRLRRESIKAISNYWKAEAKIRGKHNDTSN